MTDATTKPTRGQLQDAADVAATAVEALTAQMVERREAFQAALLAGDVDALAFRQKQDADTLKLQQLKLASVRAESALIEHDATLAHTDAAKERKILTDLEAQKADIDRQIFAQRGLSSRADGRLQSLNDRRRKLGEEAAKLQTSILQSVDGKVSTLRPVPRITEPPRRAGEVDAPATLTS